MRFQQFKENYFLKKKVSFKYLNKLEALLKQGPKVYRVRTSVATGAVAEEGKTVKRVKMITSPEPICMNS